MAGQRRPDLLGVNGERSATAGGAHEYARRVLKLPQYMNARGGSCCLGSESTYNAHARILVMLAGDESVVEPWLLGGCPCRRRCRQHALL